MLGFLGRFLVAVGAALGGVGASARAEALPVGRGLKGLLALPTFRHTHSIWHTPNGVNGSTMGLDTIPGMVYT